MRRSLTGAALLLVALVTSAAAAICPGDPDILLQTTDGADGQARIVVGIGGVSRSFILDTGAPLSVLRESVVDELGLQHVPIPLDAISGATGRPFQEGVIVPLVEFGSAQRKDVGFLIEPRSHAANGKQAGLIGANLFGPDDLELDFAHHRIALRAPGSCRPDTMPG
ncbi:MAG TPA: retropepsin-like aspartic protease, partial [Stellaceae bacterium]|nr:retropepsin-like aspartic protease [Stellaceae bacterium]